MKWRRFIPLISVLSSSAIAAPPPPPPQYIYDASQTLTASVWDEKIAALFADDVTVFENGKLVATGRDASLKLLMPSMQNKSRRIIGYSDDVRDVLVIDTFDTVDRSKLPPNFLVDPRYAARTVLYQFGADKLVHCIHLSTVASFWATPQN